MPTTTRARPLPPLLPAPRSAEARPGRLRLEPALPVVLAAGSSDSDFTTAVAFAERVREACGVSLPVETHAAPLPTATACIRLERESEEGDAYQVEVTPQGARLRGAGPAGLRYAVETFVQLVDTRGGVPACEIEDAPDFAHRGIMLDVSRGKVPTAETLRGLVDLCVRLKLNVLMLYVEHTFRFRRHPRIGEHDSPLDARTLRELDRYAAERHVALVPSLQSLGHMEHVLKHAEYARLAETDLGWTVSPAEPATYQLLGELYDEYLPNFRSALFNANCDEPWDLERGRSAGRAAELGPGGVYLEHVRRVRDLAAKHGRRTLIWGDVVHAHPERIPEIDRDLLLLDWWYEAEYIDFDRVARFAENGIEFWVCPGTSTWNSLFPRVENSCLNIARWADAGRRHGATGLLNTDWGDGGHYNLQGNSWLAYAWGAQQAWSGDCETRSFERAFSRQVFGDARGEVARLYRELGAVHEPGFHIPNGSALQYLFFDDVETSVFVSAAKRPALARCRREARARARPHRRSGRALRARAAHPGRAPLRSRCLAPRRGEGAGRPRLQRLAPPSAALEGGRAPGARAIALRARDRAAAPRPAASAPVDGPQPHLQPRHDRAPLALLDQGPARRCAATRAQPSERAAPGARGLQPRNDRRRGAPIARRVAAVGGYAPEVRDVAHGAKADPLAVGRPERVSIDFRPVGQLLQRSRAQGQRPDIPITASQGIEHDAVTVR